MVDSLGGAEAANGVAAFLEKRTADFRMLRGTDVKGA